MTAIGMGRGRGGLCARALFRAALWIVSLLVAPAPVVAQFSIFAVRDLDFGKLLPGAPFTVAPTDGAHRAELEIVGAGEVVIEVDAPAALTSMAGRLLPLRFGEGDGWARFRKGNRTVPFTPGEPLSLRIPPGQGGIYLWIGGTAEPRPDQPPGHYTATLVVRVIAPGT